MYMVGHDLVLEHTYLRVAFGQGLNPAPHGFPFLAEAYPCFVYITLHHSQQRLSVFNRYRYQVDALLVVVVPVASFCPFAIH